MDIEQLLKANPIKGKMIIGDYSLYYGGKFWIVEDDAIPEKIYFNDRFSNAFERWLELTGATLPVY